MIACHVINIVPTADREKATVRVRIAFDQLDARILPDMGVKVHFLEARVPDVAAAKADGAGAELAAVARDGEQPIVWVVREDSVERRAVRLGATRGDETDVLAGISAGEIVVLRPVAGVARWRSGQGRKEILSDE